MYIHTNVGKQDYTIKRFYYRYLLCTMIYLMLPAKPYFVLPLKSQYVDVGSTLRWRCEAGGDTSYYWLKNGKIFDSSTIPPGDQGNIKVQWDVNKTCLGLCLLDSCPRDRGLLLYPLRTPSFSPPGLWAWTFAPNLYPLPPPPNIKFTLRAFAFALEDF